MGFLDIVFILCMWEEVVSEDIIIDVLFFWFELKDFLVIFGMEFFDFILDVDIFLLVLGGRECVCCCFVRCIKFKFGLYLLINLDVIIIFWVVVWLNIFIELEIIDEFLYWVVWDGIFGILYWVMEIFVFVMGL